MICSDIINNRYLYWFLKGNTVVLNSLGRGATFVNGNIDDNRVLMDEPFRSAGSITALFKDDMDSARKIMSIVDSIKRNSEETA